MQKKIKAIIFDMDGTVLNTLDDIYQSVTYALQKNNYPIQTKDEVKLALGYGAKALIQKVGPKNISEQAFNQLYNDYQNHYDLNSENQTKPYDGILEMLHILAQSYKLAVVSNKNDYLVKPLNKYMFKQLFNPAVGTIEGIPSKPNPEMLIKVINDYQLETDEVIFVGDSEIDILTAKNANVYAIGVTWGFRSKIVLQNAQANDIIDNPMELIERLERINNEHH